MAHPSNLRFTFTAGQHTFEVIEFTLHEALSETFHLDIQLASADPAIDFGEVLDCSALLTLFQADRPVRHVHGSVSTFVQADTGFRRTRYRAVVEPRLARLRLSSDWRIFQTLSVPQIAEAVLKAHRQTLDYEQRNTRKHLPREYCVQAGDTDYDFIERIMREEGYFFAFRHSDEGHRLIHSDRLWIQGRLEGEPVLYNPKPGGDQPQPCLHTFAYSENVRTARQSQRDYTFQNSRYLHDMRRDGTDLAHQGKSYERYDYPGRAKREEPFVEHRLRGHRRDARVASVRGDDARVQPGLAFYITGHPREDMNQGWRAVRMVHHGKQYTSLAEDSADARQGTHYHYDAELVPDDSEWRPEPLPRPRLDGPQPATVVGPAGEQIYCDEYGRVKVQFPWDRRGQHDEHSSCWIQVAQGWAGTMYGQMAIPRIGQQVIVAFYDGDPDQPIIVGRAYNRMQLPPYELPRHKTRMTIKSDTHKGSGFNEMSFEDEASQEQIYFHAQKDWNNHINNDETRFVGHDRSEQIENDETLTVGHDRKKTVGNDERVRVGQDRHHAIGRDDRLEIGGSQHITTANDHMERVGNHRQDEIAANHRIQIGGNLQQQVAGQVTLQAGQAINQRTQVFEIDVASALTIKAPGGSLRIDASGITLDGVAISVKGPMTQQGGGTGNQLSLMDEVLQGWDLACTERNR